MLEALFSFRGRQGRLAYTGWGVIAASLIAIAALMAIFYGAKPRVNWSEVLSGIGLFVVAFWISLATTIKRLRDMGWTPWFWIIAICAALLVDEFLLTQYIHSRFFPPFAEQTPIGGFIGTVFLAMLLLWPPAD